jgi:hypothetical protein
MDKKNTAIVIAPFGEYRYYHPALTRGDHETKEFAMASNYNVPMGGLSMMVNPSQLTPEAIAEAFNFLYAMKANMEER